NALGGNVLLTGGLDLIFPNFISDSLRTAATLNFGNVYQDQLALDQLRYSAGVMINWNSPFGLLGLSLAVPLNKKPGDSVEIPQFSFGTSI
ncbi:MAG TPA: BamA/TamA family outer membrane protein, partial [Coxiellaceae bacterium]|nr:BamA/TamA family outer membrane protein [Coxiellaceae bacterium]